MSKKILIIEDNQDDLMIMKRFLNRGGYDNIVSAETAAQGVEAAINEKPYLVISDTLLPDGNGFEICQKIRQSTGREEPKIIITTGAIDAVDAVKAREVGADDYCAKTSDYAPLLDAVKKILPG
jgi:DNA-binding response OmpR family regulator